MLNRLIKRYLFLPPILLLTVRVLLSALFLFLVFNNQKETAWYAYLAYVYSFYTLCLVVVRVVYTIKKEKKKAEKLKKDNLITKAKRAFPLATVSFSLLISCSINFLFGIFRLIHGLISSSVWFSSIGAYYILLCAVKALLLIRLIQIMKEEDPVKKSKKKRNTYLMEGAFLLLVHLGMIVMIYLMIGLGMKNEPHPYLAYGQAFYTFYLLIQSLITYLKTRKYDNPVLICSKVTNLISSMMSLMFLQTALLGLFSNSPDMTKQFNLITGTFVAMLSLGFIIYLFVKGWRKKKENIINEQEVVFIENNERKIDL